MKEILWRGEVTHAHKTLPEHYLDLRWRESPAEALADAVELRHLLYAEFGDGMSAYANEFRLIDNEPRPTGNFVDADEA